MPQDTTEAMGLLTRRVHPTDRRRRRFRRRVRGGTPEYWTLWPLIIAISIFGVVAASARAPERSAA